MSTIFKIPSNGRDYSFIWFLKLNTDYHTFDPAVRTDSQSEEHTEKAVVDKTGNIKIISIPLVWKKLTII